MAVHGTGQVQRACRASILTIRGQVSPVSPGVRGCPAMRAAVVIEQCWHRVPGGTAAAVLDQVEAVAATGRVDQVGVAARHREPPGEAWRPAIPVRHLPLPRLALYRTWHRLRWPAVERATGAVDVVHATGYAIPPRTAPLVVTMHDVAWRRDPSMFTRNGVRFFEAGLRCVIDDADLVLCPSRATIDDCAAAGIGRDRLRHVPWGMTAADVTGDEVAQARARYGLSGRYVLSVGTLEPRKNLPRLLEAFARLPQRDITLAVVGPDGWGDSLAEPAARLGDRLRLTGFVPRSQLAALYGGASVVCYPSLWEGYGLPVAEAMGAGAPVVTSAGTATEELVVGGAGLAVDPLDVDAIAGALASVLDDDQLAARLRTAGRERAAATTWQATAEATIAAYDEVAGP
jgi:glycosyltransferase involved in cell wall biosynthesis